MIVSFERTGGFAGIKLAVTLNADRLSGNDSNQLLRLLETSNFFNLPEKFPLSERGADYFNYKISVDTDKKIHTVEVSEPQVSSTLRPLIQFLLRFAS